MSTEKVKANFIKTFKKSEKAPEFVLGKAIINIDEFAAFVKAGEHISEYKDKNEKVNRQVKLDILKSKEGDIYFTIDTYQKPQTENPF